MKSRTEILVPLAAIQAVPIAVIAWYRLHRYAWYRYSAIVTLWDGRWTTLDFAKYGTGIHTDIIKYENNLVKVYGNPYAVRIIYGPYDYVKEEF